ncbi:MAG: hypothetical protein MJK11_05550 [Pseudomonadales bacterium]|nr:hypothetical protein [Pseudomonadales bacterium]
MASLVLFSQFSVAQTNKNEQTWELSFPDNNIYELIEFVSKVASKNFVVDPSVKGRIQIISGGDELTAYEIYALFQEVLASNKYGLIEKDGFTLIVPTHKMLK